MFHNQSESIEKSIQHKAHQVGKVQVLRKENDKLRKELGQSIDEKLKLLISIKQQQTIILGDQTSMSYIFSKNFIHSILSLFQQLHNLHHYSKNIEAIQQQQLIDENINNKHREELQRMKQTLRQKEQAMQRLVECINEKTVEYERVQVGIQCAVGEWSQLKRKFMEKKWCDGSILGTIVSEIEQNWQQQTATITLLIEQRSTLRKQLTLLDKAHQLLISKIINRNNDFQTSLQRNAKINELKTKNQQLTVKLSQQKNRKNMLQQAKDNHVHNMSVRVATDIAEKWDGEKRECQNLLLKIIEKVNAKLPFRKLDDVSEIIKAAENFFQPQLQSHKHNTHASLSQQNHQLQQI